jgi:hypothetical protein
LDEGGALRPAAHPLNVLCNPTIRIHVTPPSYCERVSRSRLEVVVLDSIMPELWRIVGWAFGILIPFTILAALLTRRRRR